MRIIGGRWRGRSIGAPAGRDTRPTTDRVREAVFSSVFSILGELDDVRVLDLYAGSGALGIEALSRGAEHAVFVERDRRAVRVIEANLSALGVEPHRWRIVASDASALVTVRGLEPASLLFADPPYTIEACAEWQVLEAVGSRGLLEPGSLIVYEHRAGGGGEPLPRFTVRARKRYGDTGVTYAVYEG